MNRLILGYDWKLLKFYSFPIYNFRNFLSSTFCGEPDGSLPSVENPACVPTISIATKLIAFTSAGRRRLTSPADLNPALRDCAKTEGL